MTAGFQGNANFPRIRTDLQIDWDLTSNDLTDTSNVPIIQFDNTQLNFGEFINELIGPIFQQIKQITEPIQPVIDVLTSPIPVVSQLSGRDISLLDLAKVFGDGDPRIEFITSVVEIAQLVNSIPASANGLWVDVGGGGMDFTISGNDALDPGMFRNLDIGDIVSTNDIMAEINTRNRSHFWVFWKYWEGIRRD